VKNIIEQISQSHNNCIDKSTAYFTKALGNTIFPLYLMIYLYVVSVHLSQDVPIPDIDLNEVFFVAALSSSVVIGIVQSAMSDGLAPKRLPAVKRSDEELLINSSPTRDYGTCASAPAILEMFDPIEAERGEKAIEGEADNRSDEAHKINLG